MKPLPSNYTLELTYEYGTQVLPLTLTPTEHKLLDLMDNALHMMHLCFGIFDRHIKKERHADQGGQGRGGSSYDQNDLEFSLRPG